MDEEVRPVASRIRRLSVCSLITRGSVRQPGGGDSRRKMSPADHHPTIWALCRTSLHFLSTLKVALFIDIHIAGSPLVSFSEHGRHRVCVCVFWDLRNPHSLPDS